MIELSFGTEFEWNRYEPFILNNETGYTFHTVLIQAVNVCF